VKVEAEGNVEVKGSEGGAMMLQMASDAARSSPRKLWKPHPDDADDVRHAMECADRGEFLSPAATEAFLRWTEGVADESWREELE
jgi:hypothetical protein